MSCNNLSRKAATNNLRYGVMAGLGRSLDRGRMKGGKKRENKDLLNVWAPIENEKRKTRFGRKEYFCPVIFEISIMESIKFW